MKVFFQGIGVLFHYNFGLTSQLSAFDDMKVTLGTRHLLLYIYGVWLTRYRKNLKIVMTSFPTFPPNYQTMIAGSYVAYLVSRRYLYKKLLSRFDIVHLNDREYPYTRSALNTRKTTVLTIHWLPTGVDQDAFHKAGVLVAPSKFISQKVKERIGVESKVIYHGVDTELFNSRIPQAEAREYLGLPKGPKVILWNGRLDPIKDPKTLIDAIPIVAKEVPDSLFIIKARGGRSDILQYMKQRIKETGTEKNVGLMCGWDFLTKMPYYYRSADVCVHTSLFETGGFVLPEAMACGIPTVVTDIPAVYEPVGDAGLHFEPRNPHDLAEKLVRLLSDEKLQRSLREKGVRRVSELGLTWKEASRRYRDVYFSLL